MYLFSLSPSALCFKTTPANYFLQSLLRSFTRRTSRTFQSTASSALPSTIVEAFLLFSVCRIFLVSVACENCNWLRVCVQPAGHFRYFIRKVEKMALMDFFLSLSVVASSVLAESTASRRAVACLSSVVTTSCAKLSLLFLLLLIHTEGVAFHCIASLFLWYFIFFF